MSDCNCLLKETSFLYDIVELEDNININYNLRNLIPSFNSNISGIWRPVFWDRPPEAADNKPWSLASKRTVQEEECQSRTPDGLGISQFIKINNPQFKNWNTEGNLELSVDWIVNFKECANYSETILFWYRYYDMGRRNDVRLFPGIDLYISDGDYAFIDDKPEVSNRIASDAEMIFGQLEDAEIADSKLKSRILASGPQIDWITEILSGPDDFDYPRDEYGLIIPLLKNMSLKRYSDIGKNNYIVTKVDLFKKLVEKYGIQLVIPENSRALLTSKFKSLTGNNIEIKLNGDLYLSDKDQKSGYDIKFGVGDLILSAEQSSDTFIPKKYITENNQRTEISGQNYNVNYFKLNNKIIGYNMTNAVSGTFDPKFNSVKFHGLGGMNFTGPIKLGSTCPGPPGSSANISVVTLEDESKRAYYNNTLSPNGPWFIQGYKQIKPIGIETPETAIAIEIRTHNNSQFRLSNNLTIDYLRSESKANCSSFVDKNDTCECYNLTRLSPYASGLKQISNKDHLLFQPDTSYYNLPDFYFYGGLDQKTVAQYGTIIPGHPNPGSFLERTHSKFFPINQDCSYSLDGCNNKFFDFYFPYPGQIKLNYQGTKANFKLQWEKQSVENPPPKFTNQGGTLCLDKPLSDPSIVRVNVSVPASEKSSPWGINISVDQNEYQQSLGLIGPTVVATKGFFHPNFGWTFNENYLNKTAVVPNHNQSFTSSNNYFYSSYAMYNEEYLSGYNFIYSLSGLNEEQKKNIDNSKYVGILPNEDSQCLFIPNKLQKKRYIPSESLILEQVPFEYINMNLTYGYAYNDFIYDHVGGGRLVVSSSNSKDRVINYFDDPNYKSDTIKLFSYNDPSREITVRVQEVTPEFIRVNGNIQEEFNKGYLARIPAENQSVVVYRPHKTFNDDYIKVGKWGNLTYGDAAKKYHPVKDNYNNSTLRTSIFPTTYFSWGCPIAFVNDYNNDNKTYYFPESRLFDNFIQNQRVIHTVGTNNTYTGARPESNRVISTGVIGDRIFDLYLGSYIGNYTVKVKISDSQATQGSVDLFHNNRKVGSANLANKDEDDTLSITYNKRDATNIYGRLVLNDNTQQCLGERNQKTQLSLSNYAVIIGSSSEQLRSSSRISYFKHKALNEVDEYTTSAVGANGVIFVDGIKVSPLKPVSSSITKTDKDFSPYLDLHIFSSNQSRLPILAPSGYIFFEDFLQPKANKYINEQMQVPYNDNLYWIDLPSNQNWNIITSNGILLEKNKTYKILKRLNYTCGGSAQACSNRYPKDLCSEPYELSEDQLLGILGINNSDRQYFNITSRSYPSSCSQIDFCCTNITDEKARNDCLKSQTDERKACFDFWKDQKTDISCSDEANCSTAGLSGTILPDAEYFIFKIRDDISLNLDNSENIVLKFLDDKYVKKIPCTDFSFDSLGSSFLTNTFCSDSNISCQYIQNPNYTVGSKYVPGTLLNINNIFNNYTIYPNPGSVILDNELKYRKLTPHPNKVSTPIEEYDLIASSKYLISHTFDIKSTECVGTGKLASIKIDNVNCSFDLLSDNKDLYITSPCFPDLKLILKSKSSSTITVSKTVCDGSFGCRANGSPCNGGFDDPQCQSTVFGCVKEAGCSDAQKYLDETFGKGKVVLEKCTDVSNPQDYYLDCRYCGDESCSAGISYYEPQELECYCPSWAELVDAPPDFEFGLGKKACSHSVELDIFTNEGCGKTDTITTCGWYYYFYYFQDGVCYFPASCFNAIPGPTEEELKNYEESCPGGSEETLSRTEREVVYVGETPNPDQWADIANKNTEVESKYREKECEINDEQNKCFQKCNDNYNQCVQNAQNNNDAIIACSKSLSACSCECVLAAINAQNDNIKDRTMYYNCYSYCNTSDSMWDEFGFGWGGWWGWWGWGDNCKGNSCNDYYGWWWGGSSWQNPEDDPCVPGGCDYNSCSELEKRSAMSRNLSKCECVKQDSGFTNLECENECVDLKSELNEQISSETKIYTRDIKYIQKSKHNYASPEERMQNTSTIKIVNKKFEITYKSVDSCKECDSPIYEQVCCENKCIDPDEICCENKADVNLIVNFEIYDNLIVGYAGGKKTCFARQSYNLFRCPVVEYQSFNEKIYMCDSVSSNCSNCYVGELI
jgi:hypothetical protein